MKDQNLQKMEKFQTQCLRQILEAKAHSSTDAVEVIAQVIPFQLRLKDLCTREYARIAAKPDSHSLVKLMESSISKGNDYCPLAYIKVLSKKWIQETMDQRVRPPCNSSEEIITKAQIINRFELFEKNTIGNAGNRTEVQKQHGRKVVEDFVKAQEGKAILAFTDGSVVNGPYGAGGCAVSIIPKDDLESTIKRGKPVGMNVDNVDCEFHGVILALQTTVDLINVKSTADSDTSKLFILTDCQSAVDIVVNRTDTRYRHKEFLELHKLCLVLRNSRVDKLITRS